MSRFLCAFIVVLALAIPQAGAANRHDTLDKGLRVGEMIPHTPAVRDQDNKRRDIKSLARRRGLVLLFSRSLDW